MKKKLKVLVAFSALMVCMSSCVYSLFPIYTEDTLVFIPELIGKWNNGEKEGDYLLFESKFGTDNSFEFSVGIDDAVVSTKGGFSKKEFSIEELVAEYGVGDSITYDAEKGTMLQFNNAVTLNSESMNYKMSVFEDGEFVEAYEVNLVRLGENLIMDVYPYDFYDVGEGPSDNNFPVHTFLKLEVDNDEIKMTSFDLDKLNRLFKSNLIRLRHEKVDGTVLITAQTKELQKFLREYSNDQSVFEEPEAYSRIVD